MADIPKPQQIYRHFKGNLYQIISIAEHTETGEQMVVYQALYGDFKVYTRPLSGFMEKLDRAKYPQATQEHRFEPAVKEKEEQAVQKEREAEIRQSSGAEPVNPPEQKGQGADLGIEEEARALNIDPLVIQFLDAGSYEERLDILSSLHYRITDDMINTMALSIDVEIEEGDIEERYVQLRKCLLLYDKFECTRLR